MILLKLCFLYCPSLAKLRPMGMFNAKTEKPELALGNASGSQKPCINGDMCKIGLHIPSTQ